MGDPVKVQVEGKKRNSTIEGQRVLLKKLQKARVKHPTLTSSPFLSLSFPGKEGKRKLKENQWWVGKWVGWVRAWVKPATQVGPML
jgi:hypothetical protein